MIQIQADVRQTRESRLQIGHCGHGGVLVGLPLVHELRSQVHRHLGALGSIALRLQQMLPVRRQGVPVQGSVLQMRQHVLLRSKARNGRCRRLGQAQFL